MRIIGSIFLCPIIIFVSFGKIHAQTVLSDSIRTGILNYYAKIPQEVIYVHTDRDYYFPKDTVWFRAYLHDAATNKPSLRSKFVYVELWDNATDTLLIRAKIKADSIGVFANALTLPPSLRNGAYTLVAYTQWMCNFPKERFFYKQIHVVNDTVPHAIKRKTRRLDVISVSLMPEGGYLLAGCRQRLAYKAIGDDGLGVNVHVRLININGEVLQEGNSQHLGMGWLSLYVNPDEPLWLEARTKDSLSCRVKLPEPLLQGISFEVSQRNGNIQISPFATEGFDSRKVILIVYGSDNLIVKELNGLSPIRIPMEKLNPGVINVALVDSASQKVWAERLVFVRAKQVNIEVKKN